MLRSRLWICPFLIALTGAACADAARADDVSSADASSPAYWREGSVASSALPSTSATPAPVTRAQFFNAVSGQISLVSGLKSWRETLRGSGSAPRRDLWKNAFAQGQVALSMGSVNVPSIAGFGGASGTAFSWQGKSGASFDAGTTARPVQIDQLMQRFDKETSDDKNPLPVLDRTSVTWLRAKPVSNKEVEVEAVLLRAARDGKAGEGEAWTSGDFGSVNARLALPGKWAMRGNFTGSQMDTFGSACSWNTSANGPLKHPWGVADVSFNWRDTDAGYATFAGQNVGGDKGGSAQITQQIQLPIVTGQVVANASTQERPSIDGIGAGTEMSRDAANASANLKIQVLPIISLTATGNVSDTNVDRATGAPSTDAPTVATAHEAVTGAGGDLGLQVKVSKALSLEAGAGITQGTQSISTGTTLANLENRATLKVRHQTGGGNWAASFQTRDRSQVSSTDSTSTDPTSTNARWARIAGVGLEGERRLLGSFRLSAKMNWMYDRDAQEGDTQGVARLASAQVTFCRAANVNLRYRDGAALPSDLCADPLGSLFSSSSFATGNREIATRFNFGSAANGKGIGLAVEWARLGTTGAPNDTWKVGLTYK